VGVPTPLPPIVPELPLWLLELEPPSVDEAVPPVLEQPTATREKYSAHAEAGERRRGIRLE
jgi:hypothetical protein